MKGFTTLEKKYGITVESEGYHWNPLTRKAVETYKIYAADNCPWEKGLTRKGVRIECERWSKQLLSIKENEEKRKEITAFVKLLGVSTDNNNFLNW